MKHDEVRAFRNSMPCNIDISPTVVELRAANARLRALLRECAETLAVAGQFLNDPELKGASIFAFERRRLVDMNQVKERIEKVLGGGK